VSRTEITDSGGRTLTVAREDIRVDYLSDIDASWKFTDAAGHAHRCDYDAADHYPTLRLVWDETYWCEACRDEHEVAHRECRLCGEVIVPGTTGPGTKWLRGTAGYFIDGEPATQEQAREFTERVVRERSLS
jgi:hypothetical protein